MEVRGLIAEGGKPAIKGDSIICLALISPYRSKQISSCLQTHCSICVCKSNALKNCKSAKGFCSPCWTGNSFGSCDFNEMCSVLMALLQKHQTLFCLSVVYFLGLAGLSWRGLKCTNSVEPLWQVVFFSCR